VRRVPLIPDARALFERMRADRPGERLDAKVFHVGECQKALDRACKVAHCSLPVVEPDSAGRGLCLRGFGL